MPVTLRRLSMSAKFVLIGASFCAPVALLLYMYTSQVQKQIEFTSRELRGTAYLRPLVALRAMLREGPGADGRAAGAWAELTAMQSAHGVALQFTPEGLAEHGRAEMRVEALRHGGTDRRAPWPVWRRNWRN